MRMLCAAESGPLAPPQPWRSAKPHSAPSFPAAHFSTELFSLAAGARTIGAPVNPEKPHQGVASKKTAPHQAEIARNSTTALGLSWSWWSGTAPGARVTYDYDAWGNTVNTTGSTPNVYLYRGEQYDPDLGLYYLRARYYNPVTGRFLGRDPEAGRIKVPATLHKYLYAASDPVNRLDPGGRSNFFFYQIWVQRTIAAITVVAVAGTSVMEIWECTDEALALGEAAARQGSTIAPPYWGPCQIYHIDPPPMPPVPPPAPPLPPGLGPPQEPPTMGGD